MILTVRKKRTNDSKNMENNAIECRKTQDLCVYGDENPKTRRNRKNLPQ